MCEVMKKYEDAARAEGIAEGEARGRAEGIAEGEARGRAEGIAEGEARGRAEGRELIRQKMILAGYSTDQIEALLADVIGDGSD